MMNKERRRKNIIKAFEIVLEIALFFLDISGIIVLPIKLLCEIVSCIVKRKEISIYKLISIILESVLLHIIPFSFLLSFALMIIKIISIIVEKN